MKNERTLWWVVIGGLVILLVVMVASWNYDRPSDEAEAKAQELIATYEAAGLPTPVDAETVARTLGEDGGSVCVAADSDLLQGYLKTRLGVGGEFYYRPTRVPARTIEGYVLIAKVYCPDALPSVEDLKENLEFGDVLRG